jgi:hypothetical protein
LEPSEVPAGLGDPDRGSRPEPADDKERESFLLKELDLVEGEIKRLRAEGLSRIQFLFTATSALVGSLLVLAGTKSIDPEWLRRAGIALSFLLVCFALVTYEYLIGRDISCDRNARATGRIRHYFLERSPGLAPYLTWGTSDAPTQWIAVDISGLRRFTALLTSAVGGIGSGLLAFELLQQNWPSVVAGGVSSASIFGGMRFWGRRRLDKARRRAIAEQRFGAEALHKQTHAGAGASDGASVVEEGIAPGRRA